MKESGNDSGRARETATAIACAVACVVVVAVPALRGRPEGRQAIVRLLERCLEPEARFEWRTAVVSERTAATVARFSFRGDAAGWLLLDEEGRLVAPDESASDAWRPTKLAAGGELEQEGLRFPTGRGALAVVVPSMPQKLLNVRARLRRMPSAAGLTPQEQAGQAQFFVVPLMAPIDLAAELSRRGYDELLADPRVRIDTGSIWASANAPADGRFAQVSLSFVAPKGTQALLLLFSAGDGEAGAPVDLDEIVLEEWTLRAFLGLGAPARATSELVTTAPFDPRELPLLPPPDPATPSLRKVEDLLERRDALVLPPAATASLEVDLPDGALALEWGVTRVNEPRKLWGRRPIEIEVRAEAADGSGATVARSETLEPNGPSGWQDRSLDVSELAGRRARFTFAARSNASNDLVAIGAPLVRRRAPFDRRPSIVVVSLDTVRADHLSCQGYPRPTTPCLDELAHEAAWFRDVTTTASYTLPAHGSLLTGQLPSRHGAESEAPGRNRLYADRSDLLAVRLRDAGWLTAAFTGGLYLAPGFGFDQGFDRYDATDLALRPDDSRARTQPRPGDEEFNRRHRETRSWDLALDWIRAHDDGPSFLFLHTYLVHDYLAGPDHEARFHGSCASSVTRGDLSFVRDRTLREKPTAADLDHFVDAYDAALHEADALVGRLVATLREIGRLDSTIVVVVSDHGEEFGDHGGVNHGRTLYEEVLRVPLIVRAPGLAPREIRTPVSLVDVAPTLLELVGLAPERTIDGRSLVPMLRGETMAVVPLQAELNLVKQARWAALRAGDLKALGAFDERSDKELAEAAARSAEPVRRAKPMRRLFAPPRDPRETLDLTAGDRNDAARAAELLDQLDSQRDAVRERRAEARRAAADPHESADRFDLRQIGYPAPASEDDDDER